MRSAALFLLAACAPEPEAAFAMVGVVDDQIETGSTIGLWTVKAPRPYTFKFGDGIASPTEFVISFRIDPPPPGAIDDTGIGVAMVAMLPGRATAPEGEVDPPELQLIGLSTDSAVIYKLPGALGPAWTQAFPDGYSCGFCNRAGEPDTFDPIDCTFVTIERVISNPCAW